MPENNETENERVPHPQAALSDAQLRNEIQAARADAVNSAKKERCDRTTVVAFGLLFILPAVIIVFAMLFLLPLVARTLQEEPSGATTLRSNSGAIDQK
ncbi:hypothetical protein EON80_24010 [bacterium]|nr:MAG: hypothetical protein EON80_24010 [bacterium]